MIKENGTKKNKTKQNPSMAPAKKKNQTTKIKRKRVDFPFLSGGILGKRDGEMFSESALIPSNLAPSSSI